MSEQAMLQLVRTIKKTNRLESMPLAALKDGVLELISGHHRVRAARKAGLNEIWVMVDVTGLDRDYILAKQLAHNQIQGEDNESIVAKIFAEIAAADARLEAFVEPDLGDLDVDVRLTSRELDVTFQTRVVSLMFLDAQAALFKGALERLMGEETDVYVATREEYDLLIDAVGQVSAAYEIHSTPTIFAKMSEIVLEHLAQRAEEKVE
jgi:hypothetical protein